MGRFFSGEKISICFSMKIDTNIVEFEILTVVIIKKALVWAILLRNLEKAPRS
jgi:hypothetical protein